MAETILTSPEVTTEVIQDQYILMSGVIANILRDLFSDTARLPQSVRGLTYSSNIQQSRIDIGLREQILKQNWQSRPAIVVRPNSVTTRRMGIGEARKMMFRPAETDYHNILYIASHTVMCLSASETESMSMAAVGQKHFNVFQHQIRQALCMLRLRVGEIGQPGLLQEARQVYATPFTIGYAYDQPFAVYKIGPKVRFINVNAETK